MRSQSQTDLIDRRMRDRWAEMGGKDAYQRAQEKTRKILETYQPPQLSDAVLQNVRSIVVEAEKELGVYQGD